MLTKGSKWDAAENTLKLLLKADEVYCDSCGEIYDVRFYPCCNAPLLGRHITHLKALIVEIREANKLNTNAFGASANKSFRSCISMPRKLFAEWCRLFKREHHEELFRTSDKRLYKIDVRNAMRRFPYIRRCDTV